MEPMNTMAVVWSDGILLPQQTCKGTYVIRLGSRARRPWSQAKGWVPVTRWQSHHSVMRWLQGLALSEVCLILLSLCFPGN